MHILVVEPDERLGRQFEQQLQSAGHAVSRSVRAFEALDRIRVGQTQLMLINQTLPDLDSTDVIRIARKMGLGQYLFIMALVNSRDQETINNLLGAGADDYLITPPDAVELSLRVRNAERMVSIDTRDDAIIAMAKLAESRDSCTGRHVERVRLYSRELAQAIYEMGTHFGQIDSRFVELIYRTAALHDLGKVAIPDSILMKPGKLTAGEYDLMKRHTVIGAETLSSVITDGNRCEFLKMGREIAMAHHERWDGRGYPNGLAGNNIPLSARIVSVADVYDALTSARSYKLAFSHQQALQTVIDGAGTQFDPMVIEAFAAIERTVDQIRQREADPVVNAPNPVAA